MDPNGLGSWTLKRVSNQHVWRRELETPVALFGTGYVRAEELEERVGVYMDEGAQPTHANVLAISANGSTAFCD